VCTANPYILWNDYVIKPCLDPSQTPLRHVTATTTLANYILVFMLQKLLSLLALLMFVYSAQKMSFLRMLKVFSSVFSVSLWQNYSTTYWSGMYTTSFWVGFSGFMCTQIFLETTPCLQNFRIFFPFFHVITDRLNDGEIRSPCGAYQLLSDSLCIQKSHWIITINGKKKCKLIFCIDTTGNDINNLIKTFFWWKC